MFAASEEFYDLIYSTFKDYAAEAAQIASPASGSRSSATESCCST
jgi:hypothetical protein